MFKKCGRCQLEFPATLEYFGKQSRNKDGFKSECKKCKSEDNKKYRELNVEKLTKYKNKYKAEYKYDKEKYLAKRDFFIAKSKRYNERNKEKCIENSKIYYQSHKEELLDKIKAYQKTERGRHLGAIRTNRRDALKRKLLASYSAEMWENCKETFNNKCAYCGNKFPLTQDHFIALSKKGEYTNNNIICACRSCNSSKSDKDFFEWFPKQSFYSKQRENKILKYLNYNLKTQTQQLALII